MLEQMAEPLEQRVQQLIDGHVIKACQRGDREAFRLLFEAYKDRVFTIAVYSLRDETLAGDVTQQIFLKLMTRITTLKPKMRLPILLKYIEGLSYEEIAEVLGCSKGTVASRLNRAHKTLAKRLGHLRREVVSE